MKTHEETYGFLIEQLNRFENCFNNIKNVSTKIPTTLSVEAQRTFCQQLSSCSDNSDAAILIQLDRAGAASFLRLSKYALDFYSKNRNLATVSLPDNGRPFSLLACLASRCLEEMARGAIRP